MSQRSFSSFLPLIPVALLAGGVWAGRVLWPMQEVATGDGVDMVEAAPAGRAVKTATAPAKSTRPANPELARTWDFLQRLDSMTADEFPDFWEELRSTGPKDQYTLGDFSTDEELMVERWAEVDPAGALAWFSTKKEYLPMIRTLFRVWGRNDPEAAMAAISALKDELQTAAVAGALSSAVEDPAALLAWGRRAASLGGNILNEERFADILTPDVLLGLLAHNPSAFRELAAGLPESLRLHFEAAGIVHEATTDLPAALARIDASTMDVGVSAKFFFDLSPLAESHPDKLLALAEQFNAKFGRGWMRNPQDPAVGLVLASLARAAPDKIRALLETASAGDKGTQIIMGGVAVDLFACDRRAALQLAPGGDAWVLEFMGGNPIRPGMAGTPDQTLELVRDAPPSALRDTLLRDALSAKLRESPESAQAWVSSLAESEIQNVANGILHASGGALENAIISAASGPPDSAVTDRVRAIVRRETAGDPAGTAAEVARYWPGDASNAALQEAAHVWAEYSTADALAWAESLRAGSREHALSGIMKTWAENEPAAASEYLASLPTGPEREEPVSAFASALRNVDPAAAMQWATTLEDPFRRQETLNKIAETWLAAGSDAEKIERLESIPGLTAAEREQLMHVKPSP